VRCEFGEVCAILDEDDVIQGSEGIRGAQAVMDVGRLFTPCTIQQRAFPGDQQCFDAASGV